MGKQINLIKPKLMIYICAFFQFQGFIGPILFVFYTKYLGLTTAEYLTSDSLLFLIMAFVEVPSGMLADRFGRKKVLIISKIAISIGMLILLVSKSFAGAILVAVIYGVFGALESGVAESIIYEAFESSNKLNEYELLEARTSGIGFLVSIFYAIASGYLFELNAALPVVLDFIVSIILLLGVVFLLEDTKNYSRQKVITSPQKDELVNVIPIILVASTISSCSRTLFSFYQPILTTADIHVNILGYASALYSIVAAASTIFYRKIRSKLRPEVVLWLIVGLQVIATFGMSTVHSFYVLVFILLQQVQRGIMGPFLYMQVNRFINSKSGNRVTLMSVFYFITNILAAGSLALTSHITEKMGMNISIMMYCSVVDLVTILLCFIFVIQMKKKKIIDYSSDA